MYSNKELTKRIEKLILAIGLSNRQIEMQAGFTNGTLKRIEDNIPTAEKIYNLAKFFNVTADYLLGLEAPTPQQQIPGDIANMWFKLNEEQQEFICGAMKGILKIK